MKILNILYYDTELIIDGDLSMCQSFTTVGILCDKCEGSSSYNSWEFAKRKCVEFAKSELLRKCTLRKGVPISEPL